MRNSFCTMLNSSVFVYLHTCFVIWRKERFAANQKQCCTKSRRTKWDKGKQTISWQGMLAPKHLQQETEVLSHILIIYRGMYIKRHPKADRHKICSVLFWFVLFFKQSKHSM